MTDPVIEIEGLSKTYRRRRASTVALDGLDLSVPAGTVFGFLGPNGSGKTTTIRCLLGLVRPTAGRIRLLGAGVPHGLATTMRRVGCIVEGPALVPTMTGRRNLGALAAIDRIGHRRVDEVLDAVGLAARGDDPVRRYSLGMRQRLAIGAALLKDPELLVLDEPSNGLDPAGMREVRGLLRDLASQGRTVLVSSHLLAEVEQVCDHVAIVKRGKLVTQGAVGDVLTSAGTSGLVVRVSDPVAALSVLRRAGLAVRPLDDHLSVDLPIAGAAHVTEVLAGEGLWVSELRPASRSLEDLFLDLTDDDAGVAAPARVEVPA